MTTIYAWFTGTAINQELLLKISRATICPHEILNRGTTHVNGIPQNVPDFKDKPIVARQGNS